MWKIASKDLEFQILAPFSLTLPSGIQITAKLLVRNFGADNGTLIVGKYSEVRLYIDELTGEGYGFSVLEEPDEEEQYSRESFIDLLREWEWAGTEVQKPEWL
ncbi:hypothetical protein QUF54_06920 [Candidatus Marithioploca araucensis]|uniref:Uncharacterized protein n=1 Tax=Candidatus Marithioploca araucensis TaxID=70273 RepID=A0ABT7VU05_9GAMM|nr:hypothetical protein [Candidatus Marithioploca araucensis]